MTIVEKIWSGWAPRTRFLSLAMTVVAAVVPTQVLAVTGAELFRQQTYRYGKFEARIKFAPGSGVVSSFFLMKPGSNRPEMFWNELDVEKVGADCGNYSTNAVYGLPKERNREVTETTSELCDSFHTYAIEWTPESVAWLFDGEVVRRLEGGDAEAYAKNAVEGMRIHFNIFVGSPGFAGEFSEDILPVEQHIDWVQYFDYTPGQVEAESDFTLVWREEFDAGLSADWFTADWRVGLSQHSPQNLVIKDGLAILSLTSESGG